LSTGRYGERAMTPPDAASAEDPGRCHACRGTGKVVSGEGGTPHPVDCPWCEGTGRFIAEHDAQAARVAATR
jgi:DnaJ-class molecular chaperone